MEEKNIVTNKDILGNDHVHIEEKNHEMRGQLESSDCGFVIDFSGLPIDYDIAEKHIILLAFFFSLKTFWEMRLFWVQMRRVIGASAGLKISLLSLGHHAMIDAFEAMFCLYLGIVAEFKLFYFAFMSILKFVLLTLLEVRYLFAVWRAHNPEAEGDNLGRELFLLYRNFYCTLGLAILLVYYVFPFMPRVCGILYLCWLPQIVRDVWKGHRNSVSVEFLLGISVCRLIMPLYIFGWKDNIFSLDIFRGALDVDPPDWTFCAGVVGVMAAQVALMLGQRKLGSRFFVPLKLLPHVYDYYRRIPNHIELTLMHAESSQDLEAFVEECVICMNPVVLKNTKKVITPCDHLFHDACLMQWLDVKMECPTCRRTLPPFS